MSKGISPVRVGIYGPDAPAGRAPRLRPVARRHRRLVTAAEAEPVWLPDAHGRPWDEVLDGIHGVVVAGSDKSPRRNQAEVEALGQWCRSQRFPVLGIDHGLHILNTAHGGTVYFDLPRDLPEALQHRHPPEKRGLRHAINVLPETHLANSTARARSSSTASTAGRCSASPAAFASRPGRWTASSRPSSRRTTWWALGVQWHPASSTASGLDIQLFRGLIDACRASASWPPSRLEEMTSRRGDARRCQRSSPRREGKEASPPGLACALIGGTDNRSLRGGRSTLSMTWMTPLLAITLALITFALPLSIRLLPLIDSMIGDPSTDLADLSSLARATASFASTLPETTW